MKNVQSFDEFLNEMALISCPECNKQISDRATACPNCGFPLHQEDKKEDKSEDKLEDTKSELPKDLTIGNERKGGIFSGDMNIVRGDVKYEYNKDLKDIDLGIATIKIHDRGIRLTERSTVFTDKKIDIHFSQILNGQGSPSDVVHGKSVTGRALVGGLLLGVPGAIVGGMSGTKGKDIERGLLIITFLSVYTNEPQTVVLLGNAMDVRSYHSFVNTLNRYKKEYNKKPEPPKETLKERPVANNYTRYDYVDQHGGIHKNYHPDVAEKRGWTRVQ